jgi:TetR/AcrR family hemagglutinin/protease transcriptional regulator
MARSDVPAPRRRLPPEARRAQLIACALQAFASEGLSGGGHARVAELAGVSVPTVFHYFPTREALLDSVLDEVESFFTVLAETIHGRDDTALSVLTAHALAFLESCDSHPDHVRVWLDWSTAIREHVWPRYLDFLERLVGIVAATLEKARHRSEVPRSLDTDSAARLFVGNAHMAAVMKFSPDSRLDLEGHVRQAVTTLLAG